MRLLSIIVVILMLVGAANAAPPANYENTANLIARTRETLLSVEIRAADAKKMNMVLESLITIQAQVVTLGNDAEFHIIKQKECENGLRKEEKKEGEVK